MLGNDTIEDSVVIGTMLGGRVTISDLFGGVHGGGVS